MSAILFLPSGRRDVSSSTSFWDAEVLARARHLYKTNHPQKNWDDLPEKQKKTYIDKIEKWAEAISAPYVGK